MTFPDTTKPRKEEEVDGRDYVFVSKSEFKSKMEAGLFIEHVSKDKHMYAVSYESVWNVVAKNKSCILMLQPQVVYGWTFVLGYV